MEAEKTLAESKEVSELLLRLTENLTKAIDKNEGLLESIESSEIKSSGAETGVLRNLRARLAATHAPNSALRRDFKTFSEIFHQRYNDLDRTAKSVGEINLDLKLKQKSLEEELIGLQASKEVHEKDKTEWKERLELARREILEQDDRLTVLSQQLTGAKNTLEKRTNDLATERIAFEEEKLLTKADTSIANSEAAELQQKLREQILKNVELENTLLKAELGLHQTVERVNQLTTTNDRLQRDLVQSRQTSTRAVKQFERKTVEANRKLAQMNTELVKAHEQTKRFQEVLGMERRKQKSLRHALEKELQDKQMQVGLGDHISPVAHKAYLDTLTENLTASYKSRTPMRMEDVLRKNESLLVENANIKAEVRKLRIENSELVKKASQACGNARHMENQALVGLADRVELKKRLEKAENQYRELESSLTKQASDWIAQKKQVAQMERDIRWSQIQPIPVLGAAERTWANYTKGKTTNRMLHS